MSIEKELTNAYQTNDFNEVFEKIYNRYKNLVYFVALENCQNIEDSYDIVQDVFVSFFQKCISKEYEAKNIKSYLCSMAKLSSMNFIRSKGRNVCVNENISSSSDNYQQIEHDYSFVKGWKELLNDNERNIVIEHSINGLSFIEISRKNNQKLNTVKSTYRRAIIKLRRRQTYDNSL